jgi:sulfur-carrier protein
MKITIRVPSILQKYTKEKPMLELDSSSLSNIKSLINVLNTEYPGIKQDIYEPCGKMKRFFSIFLNNKDIRFLRGDMTALEEGDSIVISSLIVENQE